MLAFDNKRNAIFPYIVNNLAYNAFLESFQILTLYLQFILYYNIIIIIYHFVIM